MDTEVLTGRGGGGRLGDRVSVVDLHSGAELNSFWEVFGRENLQIAWSWRKSCTGSCRGSHFGRRSDFVLPEGKIFEGESRRLIFIQILPY